MLSPFVLTPCVRRVWLVVLLASLGCVHEAPTAPAPSFTPLLRLTNREVLVRFSAPTGALYRLDVSSGLASWQTLFTGVSTGLNQYVDTAAPGAGQRFYRGRQLTETNNVLIGDHFPTTQGDLVIQPRFHATAVMSWNGRMIYNDPDDAATYAGLPKADLILVSHTHGDHLSAVTIDAVRRSNAVIVVPQAVLASLNSAQRALAIVLGYGASTNVLGINIQAVPAYNANHSFGSGNGYVLTLGGRRVYFSGDTGNQPEIRALSNIDIAFLSINLPFTMSVTDATNAVHGFRPRVIYPYHYRDQGNATTNAAAFKQLLGTDLGMEVRLRKWY